MQTKNQRLLDPQANKEYYSKSDGAFIDKRMATKAHQVLDRIAWAREWVHKIGSQYHLDIGCKDGYLDLTLASEGIDCIAIDPSKDAIEEANLRKAEFDLDNVNFVVNTIEEFHAPMRFDTVSMLEVLEHVINPEEVVTKLSKLGNFVLITTPDANGRHGMKDSDQNEEHVRLYTKEELEALVISIGNHIIESVIRDQQLCIIFKSGIL